MGFNTIHYLVTLLVVSVSAFSEDSIDDFIYKNVNEDGRLNFTQMAIKYGQTCEENTVVTEDGYKLTIFHIPGDKTKPVFLTHGIADSCDGFMIRGNTSLAITLARNGYDVWCGSQRGSKYSRNHVKYDAEKDKKEYWNFGLEELAVFDLPAMLDHVLEVTGQTQLQAMGHSQGNTIFYILGAEKPDYNKKFKLFIALAPICYLHNAKSLVKTIISVGPLLIAVYKILGLQEIFPKLFLNFKTLLCSQPDIGYEFCAKGVFFPFAGSDPEELGPDFFRTVIGRYPDTASVKDATHLLQIAQRKKFSKYDYGLFENLQKYGSAGPPDYALGNVTMPIALLAGMNDNLAALVDVERLRDELPNVVEYHVMERKEFNHIDFVWGEHMPTYLYPLLLDLLKKHM